MPKLSCRVGDWDENVASRICADHFGCLTDEQDVMGCFLGSDGVPVCTTDLCNFRGLWLGDWAPITQEETLAVVI